MNNPIHRKYYNGVHYTLDKETRTVQLMPEFYDMLKNNKLPYGRGFKKIGGSSIGDVLNLGGFSSPFKAWANFSLLGLPVLDRKYVDAGIHIEPKVIELLQEKNPTKKIYGIKAEDYGYDYVKTLNNSVATPEIKKYIGGVPDGFNETDSAVLEIKTSGEKNFEKWNKDGVPASYLRQAQLYAYLMEAKYYAIIGTFLKEEDYADTHNYPIKERTNKPYIYPVNVAQAKDDINKSISWYKDYVETGLSPEYDPQVDKDLIEWLECSNEYEWKQLEQVWIRTGKYKP